jgi:hypothetical protein
LKRSCFSLPPAAAAPLAIIYTYTYIKKVKIEILCDVRCPAYVAKAEEEGGGFGGSQSQLFLVHYVIPVLMKPQK